MRTTVIAMLHHGHTSAAKMEQLSEAFWWPGMDREIHEKAKSCPNRNADTRSECGQHRRNTRQHR